MRRRKNTTIRPESAEREEISLTGYLAEFRTALREEIDAARHSAFSGAVSLLSGRRIAQVGGNYQYVFDIENALNLPGDMPGDLYVPGQRPLDVTVISVEGMAITLSIPEDIGAFVPKARLQSDLAFLMRKLIERIEALAHAHNPAGERLLGKQPISGEPLPIDLGSDFNIDQVKAVASSLGRNTTFIWGPPGTGKTSTIGAICVQLYQRGRPVLLVSHTNIAVDQALLRVGKDLTQAELAQGKVLRVGEPKDLRLLQDCNAELLLKTHVDRRAAELTARREKLIAERETSVKKVKRVSRSIDVCEWVAEAEHDINDMALDLAELQNLEATLEKTREKQSSLTASLGYWAAAAKAAEAAQHSLVQMVALDGSIADMRQRHSIVETELEKTTVPLAEAEELLVRAEAIEPLRARARELPSLEEQTARADRARADLAEASKATEEAKKQRAEVEELHAKASSAGRLTRLWRRLPDPEEQLEVVYKLRAEEGSASKRQKETEATLAQAEVMLGEIAELDEQLKPHDDVPDVKEQQRIVRNIQAKVSAMREELDQINLEIGKTQNELSELAAEIEAFRHEYSGDPDDVLRRANNHATELEEVRSQFKQLTRQCAEHRQELEQLLRHRLVILHGWDLTGESPGTAEVMLKAIRAAFQRAVDEIEGLDLDELIAERDKLNQRISAIEAEIHEIEETLNRIEEIVIADATVVATTLTRAYLRDSIQARRFDTVILDEASMAPIPALWVAASLADANAIVVGDDRQLPPIVLSEHDLAKKWLGKDIFEAAGLSLDAPSPYVVPLKVQYRMHPDISAIPNDLIYGHLLDDGPDTKNDISLADWYCHDWGHDNPVLLVDTGSVGAWVTSVTMGRRPSRLNFLSATICVDLAEQLLRENRPEVPLGERPRILIVCPYRPHAQLLELLLREQGLGPVGTRDIIAGTAHSFQGSEADVVILDMVNDEPHWRVGMFLSFLDGSTKRLLNVALTRAKRRLIIVGDFDYIVRLSKKAFIGRELIPYLRERYPCVDALEVVPAGLAARAAKAQSSALGGEVEPDAARFVVTQEDFFPVFRGDIARASARVIIYSPFMTQARLGHLEPQIRAALERGVRVYVITKTHSERGKRELSGYRMLEQALTDWGVVVIHKRHMHEKLIFIDEDIVWSGSLNPLSFSDTQEVMERRKSRAVFKDYVRTLRLDDLIGAYSDGMPRCPICGREIVATEGKDDPFFWRCVEDGCYSRSIDQPPLKDGVITCSNCGGAVEYGEWGGKPAWRCLENRHHHQRVVRTHLRLPKMRAIIPRQELRELDKRFGITSKDLVKGPPQDESIPKEDQMSFDDGEQQMEQYLSFEEARKFARNLGLKGEKDWYKFCRGEMPEKGCLPSNVPQFPQNTYRDKGWLHWGDWLKRKKSRR